MSQLVLSDSYDTYGIGLFKNLANIIIIALPIIKIDNSRILEIARSLKITNSQKSKHAKITGPTV